MAKTTKTKAAAKVKKTKPSQQPDWKGVGGNRKPRGYSSEEIDYARAVGKLLQARRVTAGLTQAELGEAVGCQCVAQCRRETGVTTLSVADLYRYALVLGCNVADFLPTAKTNNATSGKNAEK
jgi:hypothetical protein